MKENFKIFLIYIMRFFTRFLFIFPVKKNKVSFIAYGGRSYSCSPKSIYEKLIKQYGNSLEYIWFIKNSNNISFPDNTKIIKPLSFKYFYNLATSKVIISNFSMIKRPPLRKNQIFINTWHGGGAYKKVGISSNFSEKRRTEITFNLLAKDTTWFVSSCKKFTEAMTVSVKMPQDKFLEIGLPRNDLFFTDYSSIQKKVREYYKIPDNYKIFLYAPTYRGEPGNYSENVNLDIEQTISFLEKRFNSKFLCIYRGHYYIHDKTLQNTINASEYPDMQELLCAADILITDFSSSMWDFGLMKKPCFLFAPDLKSYSSTREFYTEPETWGFPISTNMIEMEKIILNFDEKEYLKNIEKSYNYLGSFENGNSCNQLISKIFSN